MPIDPNPGYPVSLLNRGPETMFGTDGPAIAFFAAGVRDLLAAYNPDVRSLGRMPPALGLDGPVIGVILHSVGHFGPEVVGARAAVLAVASEAFDGLTARQIIVAADTEDRAAYIRLDGQRI